jgi:hypothetical protein
MNNHRVLKSDYLPDSLAALFLGLSIARQGDNAALL